MNNLSSYFDLLSDFTELHFSQARGDCFAIHNLPNRLDANMKHLFQVERFLAVLVVHGEQQLIPQKVRQTRVLFPRLHILIEYRERVS